MNARQQDEVAPNAHQADPTAAVTNHDKTNNPRADVKGYLNQPGRLENLARNRFNGRDGREYVTALWLYGTATLHHMILGGRIFEFCSRRDFGVSATSEQRNQLRTSQDDRDMVVSDTLERAIPRFLSEHAVKWSPDGGSAPTTYFINFLRPQFANAFRKWSRAQVKHTRTEARESANLDGLDETVPCAALGPEDIAAERDFLRRFVAALPPEQRVIALELVDGAKRSEIARRLGITDQRFDTELRKLRRYAAKTLR